MSRKSLVVVLASIVVVVLLGLCLHIFEPYIRYQAAGGHQAICPMNLHGLGRAMKLYAEQNEGKSPFQSNWCDILVDELWMTPKALVCPEGQAEPCSYALNRNVVGLQKAPDDMVVFFDSKPGWNQVGGAELLAPENHGGKGCNILFGNFEVKFVRKADFGALRWNPEKTGQTDD